MNDKNEINFKCVHFLSCPPDANLSIPASNSSRYSSCCSTFFHSSPFFTPVGTCFTTKATVTETSPATYSNIRVWVYLDEDEAPEMDMVLLGMEAAERDGIFW